MTKVEKNWLEWVMFWFGLAFILLMVAYLAYDAVTTGNEPPIIEVQFGATEPRNGSYVIPVTLQNLGDQTAEDVAVEVTLLNGQEEVETAELTIAFLPRQSTRSGWVTFTTDPATVEKIEPHVLGYQEP
jgi:uncharacterized protein (TIGR02588 family)